MIDDSLFVEKLKGVEQKNLYFGTITTELKVLFDGEDIPSEKQYPCINGYVPIAGDRVALYKQGSTYTLLGSLNGNEEIIKTIDIKRTNDFIDEVTFTYESNNTNKVIFANTNGKYTSITLNGKEIAINNL